MFAATCFRGQKVAVFGLARSGSACVEALQARRGARCWPGTIRKRRGAKAKAAGCACSAISISIDFGGFSTLWCSAPACRSPIPNRTGRSARRKAAGIEIIGDTEVFQRQIAGTGARLVAITGTNGKSTTTALIGHLFKSAGRDVEVGGNIGTAVFLLDAPRPERIYVLELSSFQIDLMPSLEPDAGVLLNLSPDHLDRHGTMADYAAVKARMFAQPGTAIRRRSSASMMNGVKASPPPKGAVAGGENFGRADARRRGFRTGRHIAGADGWRRCGDDRSSPHAGAQGRPQLAERLRGLCGGAQHRSEHRRDRDRNGEFSRPRPPHGRGGASGTDIAVHQRQQGDQRRCGGEGAWRPSTRIYWIAGGIPKAGGIEPLAEVLSGDREELSHRPGR